VRSAAASTLVVSLAVVLVACGSAATAARPTPPPVRIGAIYDLTGAQAPLDAPSLDGARLAVDRINAQGGLMGRRVELLERDGQTNETEIRRAAAGLVASGCSAIIGLSDTEQVLAAAPIAASAGVPFVTSGATSPKLPEQVPNWLYLACFGDNAQAAASAQFATDRLGARTAAVLFDKDTDYTRLLARYFERSFRAQGGNVVASWDLKAGRDALRAYSRTAAGRTGGGADRAASSSQAGRAATADVVFAAATPETAPVLIRQLRSIGLRQPIMGGDSFDTPALVAMAEKTGGKLYYTTHAAVGMSSASRAVRRFDASYQAAYGLPPENAFAALGYDTVDLVASAIRRADSVRPAAVRDAIRATRHFPGVTGSLSYDAKDGVPTKKVTVVCVGRRPVVVAQFTPGYVPQP
jgi:branched-chain amino acid transport system substrate-binding protein